MSFNKLYFNRVDFKKNPNGSIDFRPNLICPKCRKYSYGKIVKDDKIIYKTSENIPANATSKIVEYNQRKTFIMPCCGAKIELYVAVHDESLCISVEPIAVEWWKMNEI